MEMIVTTEKYVRFGFRYFNARNRDTGIIANLSLKGV
jgi:hypothetical protein